MKAAQESTTTPGQYPFNLCHVIGYMKECVIIYFPTSVAYLYSEEQREVKTPYPSIDALRRRFEKLSTVNHVAIQNLGVVSRNLVLDI